MNIFEKHWKLVNKNVFNCVEVDVKQFLTFRFLSAGYSIEA